MLVNLFYAIALLMASPVVVYRMIRHQRYRRGIREKLFGLSNARASEIRGDRDCLWIHAVSVGEVNLLPDIVRQLQQRDPNVVVAISSSTDTGYNLAVKRFGAHRVFFCPLDFTWSVCRTIKNLSPQKLVLVELELWPNLIAAAHRHRCPVMVINARLSERSATGYQRFSRLLRPTFARLAWVGCQDESTRERFEDCGTPSERSAVTGSMKFDNAPTSRESASVQRLAHWAGVDPWHRVWIVGSTQSGEEAMALEIYRSLRADHPELRLVLVPRHQERFDEVATLVSKSGLSVHRRSVDGSLFDRQWTGGTVILVDMIGELRDWWGVGQIATVGGSFGDRGGQNMLEPAGYGSAVSFGPNTRNFRQIAEQLIDAGGAIRVNDRAQLEAFVRRCLDDGAAADALGMAARSTVLQHRGATQRTVDALCNAIHSTGTRKAA